MTRSTNTARIALAAALAVASLTAAGAASAKTHEVTRAARVSVADLDLSRADHAARFEQRITRAAYDICPAEARQNSAKAEACRADLHRQAVAGLSAAQRTQYAQATASAYALAAR